MESQESKTSLGLDQYVRVLWWQWRTIAIVTGIALLAGIVAAVVVPREYTATSTVNLTVISTEPFAARSAPSNLLDNQEEQAIANSQGVAVLASEKLPREQTPSQIRAASEVSADSGPAVVTVSFTSASSKDSAAGADAVAHAYIEYRQKRANDRIELMTKSLTERIDDTTDQIADQRTVMSKEPENSARYEQAASVRDQLKSELDGLISARNELQGVDTTGGFILNSADDSSPTISPDVKRLLLAFIAVGLFVGIVLAFLRDLRDHRVRSADEVAGILEAPRLAEVDSSDMSLPARGGNADALRASREWMLLNIAPGSVVTLIDATHADDAPGTALNLALATARSGSSVQVIVPEGEDRARKMLHQVLPAGSDHVSLSGMGGELSIFHATDVNEEAQRDLLITQETIHAIESAGDGMFTFIVLDSDSYSASILGALRISQASLLITRERATTKREVSWLREVATDIGTPIVGTVFERVSRRGSGTSRASSRPPRRRRNTNPVDGTPTA